MNPLLLRPEERDYAERQSVLMIGSARRTLQEELVIGPVPAVLEASQQTLHPLVLISERELFQVLCCSGREPVVILEPLEAWREGAVLAHPDLGRSRDAVPLRQRASLVGLVYEALVPSVVKI